MMDGQEWAEINNKWANKIGLKLNETNKRVVHMPFDTLSKKKQKAKKFK